MGELTGRPVEIRSGAKEDEERFQICVLRELMDSQEKGLTGRYEAR